MVKAELAKLWRPAVVGFAVSLAGLLALVFAAYQDSAEVQRLSARSDYETLRNETFDPSKCKEYYGLEPGRACEKARADELESAKRWIERSRGVYPFAHVQQHPVGILGVIAAHLASAVGVVGAGIITATHAAGEWTGKTINPVLARYGRGAHFVVYKFIGGFVGMAAVWLSAAIILIVLSPLLRWLYADVHPSPDGYSTMSYAVERSLLALPVIAFFVAAGVLAAVVIRNPLGSLIAVLATLAIALVLPGLGADWGPGSWIARWMDFGPKGQFGEHLWVAPPTSDSADMRLGVAGDGLALALSTAAALTLATVRMRRMDIA